MEALAPLRDSLRAGGHAFLKLVGPPELSAHGAFERRALAGYPLMELDEAAVAVAGYALLVGVGLMLRPDDWAATSRAAKVAEWEKAEAAKAKAKAAGLPPPRRDIGFHTFSIAKASAKVAKEPLLILMSLYNVLQVALCGYMMVKAASVAWLHYARPICNPHNNVASSELKDVLWLFYVSKVLDFADTFFIVARGKWDQFSFLHIYHHFSIFLTYWLVANAAPDGDVFYTVVANSFVHFVMYFYYFCTALACTPFQNIVTDIQLTQFVTMMTQACVILGSGVAKDNGWASFDCPYPKKVTAFYLGYIMSLFMLFNAFKAEKYQGPAKAAAASPKAEALAADEAQAGGKKSPAARRR